MNGQENDDEITGNHGTHTSAEYWEYDTRLIRRWNTDPVDYEWQSPYVCFNNNPIYFADPDGMEATDWVKNNKTGVTEWDASVTDQKSYNDKYGGNADYSYSGKWASHGIDATGAVFNGHSNGDKRYLLGQKATANVDGSMSAPVEKNSPGNTTTKEIEKRGRDIAEFTAYYNWASNSSGRIDQSISPFDFWSPANFLRTGVQKESQILYRVLRNDEDIAKGVFAKNPGAGYTIAGHVTNGGRATFHGSQFISTTLDLNVALRWAAKNNSRIAVIDATLVRGKIYNLSTRAMSQKYIKGVSGNNFANASKEVLIDGFVPAKALKLLD